MAIEDIDRLKEKINKDPDSKLFVPLAEEYKKEGMLEEAIDVLTKGLERQPHYLSARVSLGRIYIERSLLEKARAEFEKIVAVIPDNLYAHKKLAEICRDLGKRDEAIKEFKTVLRLHPMDEWAATSLSVLEEKPTESRSEAAEEVPLRDKEPEGIPTLQEEPSETEEGKPFGMPFTEKDFEISEVFSEESIGAEKEEETPEIPVSGEEEPWSLPAEEIEKTAAEKDISSGTAMSREDMDLWETHLETVEEIEEKKDLWETAPDAEETGTAEPVEEAGELYEEETMSFEDIFKEPEASDREGEFIPEKQTQPQHVSQKMLDEADHYILLGKYGEAMNTYKTILSVDPGNKHILQCVEELRSLLKLMGKDKEALIMRLDCFLEGIKKRRDEFSGSA